MADVFVSYARGDERTARIVAQRLTEAGYSVWWDSELLPHNRFANVIEEEIGAAGAVLVIWSQIAAKSQWVRAEAELGRADGKLVQVAIDQSPIPLPFNQYQIGDLRRWRGDPKNAQWQKVLASVAHFQTAEKEPIAAPKTPAKRISIGRNGKFALAGVAALALVGGGVAVVRSFEHPARGARIAVQPFRTIGTAAGLSDFAAGLSDSLQNVLTQDQLQTLSPAEADALKGDDLAAQAKKLGVGLMFSGTVQAKSPDIDVSMRLDDPVQHATLWTADMSGAAAQSDQLQARVGALTVAVLNCSEQGLAPGVRLTDSALQAFLHACELSQTASHGLVGGRATYAMLDAMRQAAREAPDFAAAHSVLAKHLAFVAAYQLLDQTAPLRDEAEREARRALELDPKDPDAFVTFGLLTPPLDYSKREAFYRQALASNPSWSHANGFLANVMSDTGRLHEAAALYQRAASVNPQSTDWASAAADGLVSIGQTQEADQELARLSQLWPNDPENFGAELDSLVAQKRWADALKLLNRAGSFAGTFSSQWITNWRRTLTVLQSDNPAMRNALRQDLLAIAPNQPEQVMNLLALLGFTDDAIAIGDHDLRVDSVAEDSAQFLFSPYTAALRHDPRFMTLAARFGLVDYWRSTGHWPDFCSEPGLPYDCRQVAAKVAAEPQPR
ncbi:MAG: TIR domain-containing protein [Sphingomicrobium sp.]